MSTTIPLQPGVHYHLYNRGNNHENLFVHEGNYRYFLRLCSKYLVPVVDTYAYCLLPNHFHLLVRIKPPGSNSDTVSPMPVPGDTTSPSRQLANLFSAYSKAFNKAFQRSGSLFEKRFHRLPVASSAYFAQLVVYIHRNPQTHGLVSDFRDWPYSSYHSLLAVQPTHLQRDEVLGWFGGRANLHEWHQHDVSGPGLVDWLMDE